MKVFILYLLLIANDGTQSLSKVTGNQYKTKQSCNVELNNFKQALPKSSNIKFICSSNINKDSIIN